MLRDFQILHLQNAVDEIKEEYEFYQWAFQLGRLGPWEQYENGLLYMSPAWCRLVGIKKPPETLEDYLDLIVDEEERRRVRIGRDCFLSEPLGTKWSDRFTLAGRTIHGMMFMTESGRLIGVDLLM